MSHRFLPTLIGALGATVLLAQPPASINQKDAQGRKQGPWQKMWADRQQLRYEGRFKDDKPVGRFTFYSTSGKLESTVDHYATGDGAHARHFHPNGKLMAEGRYAGEAKDSTWDFLDEEGRLRSTENWQAGVKDGEQTAYYPDGKVAERSHFRKGVQHGKAEEFFPDGKLKSTADYVNGAPEGLLTWYQPDGKKDIEGRMVNGERDGAWTYYNPDGSVQVQVLYAQGVFVKDKKENGVFKEYYDDEQLKSETTWKNGRREGRFTEYHDNGRWVTRPLKLGPEGGEKNETERELEGQTKKREGTYKNDVLEGEVKEYDEQGRMTSITYLNGRPATGGTKP